LAKFLIALFFLFWLIFALPYYHWLYRRRPVWLREEESKSVLVLQWLRRTVRDFTMKKPNENERVALTGIIVKAFFFPVMLNFFTIHVASLTKLSLNSPWATNYRGDTALWVYSVILSLLFLVDTSIFTFAYAVEFPALKNHIKSVDPTFGGWFVALICYPPFNQYSGGFIWGLAPVYSSKVLFGDTTMWLVRIIILFLFGIYLWATLALLWKSGNLVNRGIISHGPYKFVRHPSYVSKNIAWWFERLPYMTTPLQAVPLLLWNFVYVFRALTEEKHLLRDPDYQEYTKKVKHRFIPRLI